MRDLGGKITHNSRYPKNSEECLSRLFYGPGQVPWQWNRFEASNIKNVFIISKSVMFYDLGLKM